MRVLIAALFFTSIGAAASAENCYVGDGYFLVGKDSTGTNAKHIQMAELRAENEAPKVVTKEVVAEEVTKEAVTEVKAEPIAVKQPQAAHPLVKRHGHQQAESVVLVTNNGMQVHEKEWAKIIKKYNDKAAKPKTANQTH